MTGAIYGLIVFISKYIDFHFHLIPQTITGDFWENVLGIAISVLVLKFTVLSSIHASEHQIINAMESGSKLNLESVKSQSRFHRRCGTNVVAFLWILGICMIFIKNHPMPHVWEYFAIFAALVISACTFGKFGEFLQQHFTTKTARDTDIEKAIEVGIEHNTKFVDYVSNTENMPNAFRLFFMSINNSGAHYLLLSMLLVANLLSWLLKIH